MKFVFKFFIFLTIMMCCLYATYRLYQNKIFKVSEIEFKYSDSNPYFEFQHQKIVDLLVDVKKKQIWSVDIFEIEKKIEALNWIEDIQVSKKYPSTISIEIIPKKILASLLRTSNKIQPIAEDSTIMEIADISKSPDVPILSDKKFLKEEILRKNILSLLKSLPKEGSFSLQSISEVQSYTQNSFQFFLKNTHALVIMDNENVDLKAARVSRVIDYMEPGDLKSRIIDANFSKKVLVKPRNHR